MADDLLGLCAWHIHSDLYVISIKANTIEQQGSLVNKGGLLTNRLRCSREADLIRVSWSMPLAHLLFCGNPVMSRQVVGSMASRVPFHRGIQVILRALGLSRLNGKARLLISPTLQSSRYYSQTL